MKQVLEFIITNWKEGIGIAAILYEFLVRLKPTKKNWSIAFKIYQILDLLIPNFQVDRDNGKIVRKRTLIKCVVVFLLFGAGSAYAQNPNNKFTATYYYNSDTTLIYSTRNSLQSSYGNSSAIYYDTAEQKLKGWQDSAYFDLITLPTPVLDSGRFWKVSGTTDITGSCQITPSDIFDATYGTPFDRFGVETHYLRSGLNIDVVNGTDNTFSNFGPSQIQLQATSSGSTYGLTINDGTGGSGFQNKLNLNSTTAKAPLNIGAASSDPSGVTNNDIFINNTGNDLLKVRLNGVSETIITGSTIASGQVTYFSGTQVRAKSEAAFSYNESTNTLGVDIITGSASPTGLALVTTSNGNISVSPNGTGDFTVTTSDELNFIGNDIDISTGGVGVPSLKIASNQAWQLAGSAGSSGQVLTSNGGSSAPTWTTISSGLTKFTTTITAANFRNIGTVPITIVTNDNVHYYNPVSALLIAGTGSTNYAFTGNVIINNVGNNCASCALMVVPGTAINTEVDNRANKFFDSFATGNNGAVFRSQNLVLTTDNALNSATGDRNFTLIVYYTTD